MALVGAVRLCGRHRPGEEAAARAAAARRPPPGRSESAACRWRWPASLFEHPDVGALSGAAGCCWSTSTVIQFCVAYVCWFAALARLPASVAAIGTMAVPVIGVVASAVALHEPLGLGQIAAWCSRSPASCWRRGHDDGRLSQRKGRRIGMRRPSNRRLRFAVTGRGAAGRHSRDRFPTADRRTGRSACSRRRRHRRPAGGRGRSAVIVVAGVIIARRHNSRAA